MIANNKMLFPLKLICAIRHVKDSFLLFSHRIGSLSCNVLLESLFPVYHLSKTHNYKNKYPHIIL